MQRKCNLYSSASARKTNAVSPDSFKTTRSKSVSKDHVRLLGCRKTKVLARVFESTPTLPTFPEGHSEREQRGIRL